MLPLQGMTVVAVEQAVAAPFASRQLADLGARVIKIEGHGGDPLRFSFGVPETGAARVMEGKESLTVDLRTPEGRQLVHELIAKVDAFVNGKLRKRVRGHRVTRIAIARLPRKRFKVRIVAHWNTGERTISTRVYKGCKKSRPHTHVER